MIELNKRVWTKFVIFVFYDANNFFNEAKSLPLIRKHFLSRIFTKITDKNLNLEENTVFLMILSMSLSFYWDLLNPFPTLFVSLDHNRPSFDGAMSL